MAFGKVENEFFGRELLAFGKSFSNWVTAFKVVFGDNPQAAAYFLIEWAAVILGFTTCIIGFKRHPEISLFGFVAIFLSFTSGPAQGMHRYILVAPSVFLFLARKGENPVFDRVWTIVSILLMGIYAALFSFNMWAG